MVKVCCQTMANHTRMKPVYHAQNSHFSLEECLYQHIEKIILKYDVQGSALSIRLLPMCRIKSLNVDICLTLFMYNLDVARPLEKKKIIKCFGYHDGIAM